jgi:hypothetical protein
MATFPRSMQSHNVCTSTKVPHTPATHHRKVQQATPNISLEVLADHAVADIDLPWKGSTFENLSRLSLFLIGQEWLINQSGSEMEQLQRRAYQRILILVFKENARSA